MKQLLGLAIFLLPVITFAQATGGNPQGAANFIKVNTFFGNVIVFINSTLVPAIFALAFLVFIWGMFKTFILGGHDEEKQGEGKKLMMYAILGFVIMISIWGIVNLIANSIGLGGQTPNELPIAPGVGRITPR
jgi:hypothetical protein